MRTGNQHLVEMGEKQEVDVDVTKHIFIAFVVVVSPALLFAQNDEREYKKRVLENTEIELLSSFYQQDGNNAAVTGGLGTEELTDYTATVVVSIPINEDDILKIDAGVSAYTSASSSNIDPFEVGTPNPFISNSGASERDTWVNGTATYIHSSDDRNTNWSLKASVSNEYDYTSVGFGGSYAKLMNQKNTEIGFHGNVFLDSWRSIYPIELTDGNIVANNTITGNSDYSTAFSKFTNGNRNSYSGGVSLSQILSQKIQGSVIVDVIKQEGLLSTPFQRVYFADVEDSFIGDFHLADDVERLPNSRLKLALGGRLNAYVNEVITLRSFMRYYQDDWGIVSGTAQIEMPIKLGMRWAIYPSYRYYKQSRAKYFGQYNTLLSTDEFYTSDFDLSEYRSSQYGFGISYNDIFLDKKLLGMALKGFDLKAIHYERNTGLNAWMISGGLKIVMAGGR